MGSPMSTCDAAILFRAAVLNCLGRCEDSYNPLDSAAEFLEKLTAAGWNDSDVQAIWMTVVPLLAEARPRGRRGHQAG